MVSANFQADADTSAIVRGGDSFPNGALRIYALIGDPV